MGPQKQAHCSEKAGQEFWEGRTQGAQKHESNLASHPAEPTPTTPIKQLSPNSVTKHLAPVCLFAQAKYCSSACVVPTPNRTPRQNHICPDVTWVTLSREKGKLWGLREAGTLYRERHQKQCGLQVESRKIWIQK